MKIINTVFVHSVFIQRTKEFQNTEVDNLEEMLNWGLKTPQYAVNPKFITDKEFLSTSDDCESDLLVFDDKYLNDYGMDNLEKIRSQLSEYYLEPVWFAKEGTEKRIADKVGTLSASNVPEEKDLENYEYIRKLIRGEYQDF